MDIKSCGVGGESGLILNLNGSGGTLDGKRMMYSTLMAAFMAGKTLSLCSDACDSQHATYSRVYAIDNLQ